MEILGDDEDRYEAINFIVKVRPDGQTWYDIISDLVTGECQGDPEVEDSCTCGLESMGGCSGSLDQCYRSIGIADDLVEVKKADLLLILAFLDCDDPNVVAAARRLLKECTWWEDYLARSEEEEEEEEEEELLDGTWGWGDA